MALEVIGAGFGRTGTNSLKLALEHLGFGPCHHMFEVRDNPEQLLFWEGLARGGAVDWERVFEGYRSQVDWPGARYWRELSDKYLDAKVILTERDPNEWYRSVRNTIAPFMYARGRHNTANQNAIAAMAYATIVEQVFDGRLHDQQHAIAVYRRHSSEVRATISSDRLLVINIGEGWSRLCEFLGVDTPDEPFPHTNTSRDFRGDPSRG